MPSSEAVRRDGEQPSKGYGDGSKRTRLLKVTLAALRQL